jgi:hypothetical protein
MRTTLSGNAPKTFDTPAPDMDLNPSGTHKDYWVLSAEERAKGFVRPYRQAYTHKTCRTNTSMGMALAETFAVDPSFYSHTFCFNCGTHPPVGEFSWAGTEEAVGS